MFTPLLLVMVGTSAQAIEPAPASALALEVAEAVGATLHKLSLSFDPAITPMERRQLSAALERTGLFELVPKAQAAAVLNVDRVSDASVKATVTQASGKRIWASRVQWPAERNGPPAAADSEHQARQEYQRRRLRIAAVLRSYTGAPFLDSDWGRRSPWGVDLEDPSRWRLDLTGVAPMTVVPTDWLIRRGATEVIDELQLADLLGDRPLKARIEAQRHWPRNLWIIGLGVGALAGIGTGTYLSFQDSRDARATGVSLILVGAAGGVAALLYAINGPRHSLDPAQAQRLVNEYNEKLRVELGLGSEPSNGEP
jgi:hypothetical protein